jgi:adenylate cyclase
MRIRIPWYRKAAITLGMVAFWTLAFGFFHIIRFYGWKELGVQFGEIQPVKIPVSGFLAIGGIAGLFLSFLFIFLFPRWSAKLNKWPLGLTLIVKTALYFIAVKILFLAGIFTYSIRENVKIEGEIIRDILTSDMFRVLFLYFIVVSTLLSFFIQMGQRFGPEVLLKMILGRYRKPREEERVFMFLDLKSSTRIAEKLGHVLYSQLLQACFADVSQVVINTRAEIYQYVGDEIVLSWSMQEGLHQQIVSGYFSCIRMPL